MVVRKPIPAGAFRPVCASPVLPFNSASSPSLSSETLARVTSSTQTSVPKEHDHSKPNPEACVAAPDSFDFDFDKSEHLFTEGDDPAGKPLRAILQARGKNRSTEESHPELPNIFRPGLSASGKATPSSSVDSGTSREFCVEDLGDSRHGKNGTSLLQRSPQFDNAPVSLEESTAASIPSLRSNNPFRNQQSDNGSATKPGHQPSNYVSDVNSKERQSKTASQTPLELAANLSLARRPFSESSTIYRPSTLNPTPVFQKQEQGRIVQKPTVSEVLELPTSPPLISHLDNNIANRDSSLIPVSTEDLEDTNINVIHSGLTNPSDGQVPESITVGVNGRSSIVANLGKELPAPPQVDAPLSDHTLVKAINSLDTLNQYTISQGITPREPHLLGYAPPKPPRPRTSPSLKVDAELVKLREQRNETYQIKHFNWFDHNSRTLRRSSMLTQNKNGPCPLLALVNALILGEENDSRSALGAALRTREQVSLGLIIESLMDELTSEGRGVQTTELPDVDELNRFLLMLHTGMTANPRLTALETPSPNLMDARNSSLHLPLLLNNDRKPGTFESTPEMQLYGAFGIPLVHGWLAPRSDPARAAFVRSAPTYEDAQTIQFGEEELEEKLSRVGLSPKEQQLLQDISSIKSFLESHPTQITSYGLEILNECLFPGSVAILFRNDHFSTIYKHPESRQMFTLVTDAGYSDKDEVIWESLVDVSGQNSEFFSGDFRPVGNADASKQPQQSRSDGTSTMRIIQQSTETPGLGSPPSPQGQQQQHDADFAMALQLQEEEEARMDDFRRLPSANDATPSRNSDLSNSLRLGEGDGSRPAIPPRNTRNQGVNRVIDASLDEAPPPAYEEAAKGRPYLPPTGHPQHASFDSQSPFSGPSSPMHSFSPGVRQAPQRRMSAFQESSLPQATPPMTRQHTNNSFGVAQSSGRPRDRDKDCIVM